MAMSSAKRLLIAIILACGVVLIAILTIGLRGPYVRPFLPGCDWQAMVDGRCDKHIKGYPETLSEKELNYIMKHGYTSREAILKYADERIEYYKKENERFNRDSKPFDCAIRRLEGVKKVLQ